MSPETAKKPEVAITKQLAAAIHTNVAKVNSLLTAAQEAQKNYQTANEILQSMVLSLILSAGYKQEDFKNYGVWEDPETGEFSLRPN